MTIVRSLTKREIVDVSVRVVALDTLAEPKDVGDAEVIAQSLLDLLARKSADFGLDSEGTLRK